MTGAQVLKASGRTGLNAEAPSMTSQHEVTDLLLKLAASEFAASEKQVAELPQPWPAIFVVEGCRVLDLQHVIHYMSSTPERGLSDFDFFLMLRGWNSFLHALLPRAELPQSGGVEGIPIVESTPALRQQIIAILVALGKATLLRENAAMVRHGIASGEISDKTVRLRNTAAASDDHFLDRLEGEKLDEVFKSLSGKDAFDQVIENTRIENLDERIKSLVFPFRASRNTEMVGYHAEPDIDRHYFALVLKGCLDGISEAGLHPAAQFGKVSGDELGRIIFLITSFYLKHIRFTEVGKRTFPQVNYAMSLTIWKSKAELIESLAAFTGMPKDTVLAAIDFITVRKGDAAYFQAETTPFIPVLIQLGEDHLLSPVSSVFKNPLTHIRMLAEFRDKTASIEIRRHREEWMRNELYGLFEDDPYLCMSRPLKLRRGKTVVTDIDAAVFDVSTGELALFQLKWQDFSSNDVGKQRSRAKNFTDQIDAWTLATEAWFDEFGAEEILREADLPAGTKVSRVLLFAVGRAGARFRSYGYEPDQKTVACCTWPQIERLKHQTAPSNNFLSRLYDAVRAEADDTVTLRPLPQTISVSGYDIVIENLWNEFVTDHPQD